MTLVGADPCLRSVALAKESVCPKFVGARLAAPDSEMEPMELQDRLSKLTEAEIMENLRSRRPAQITEPDLTPSAIMVPLFRRFVGARLAAPDSEGWVVLFTKRSQKVEAHKGEISFPGGVIEPGESALGAALREIEEEVGIKKERIRLLGELDEILTMTGFRIRPFVASLDWPVALRPNQGEIEEIYILPLAKFLDPGRLKIQHWQRKEQDYPVYHFQFPECTVWGATAKIIKNLLERLLGITLA